MNPLQNNINETASNEDGYRNVSLINRKTSMATLILWNISKALEKNPVVEIKSAMKAVQARLENNSRNLNTIGSQYPEERYLACALLAWQELGHKDTDSLYRFIEANRSKCESVPSNIQNKYKHCSTKVANTAKTSITTKVSNYSEGVTSGNFDTCSLIGPVIKLPVETKIVMRLENTPNVLRQEKKKRRQDKDTMKKIDAACCMDSACVERLSELDAVTSELRMRAGQLASREAKRVELLERAETAWKDLELGYQRRLILAEEKEEDMAKQIHKLIEERNSCKHVCTTLSNHLKERGEAAEKDRMRLTEIEKNVCDRACQRLRLTEESARGDAIVAEHQCKAAQLDRSLQFKEEQARRKLSNVENEVESARALTYEAERAMRSELAALRDQIDQVSHQLLREDAENSQTKKKLEELKQEKLEMAEDLEGCKVMCDSRMQDKVTKLKKKREELSQLRDKVTECQCKMPIDATVEAKRTPSLAASCKCTPEDKLLESCSCTSLRSRLLSNLLADLFGGLQAELGGSGSQMPCHLLKCLEDKHNWDRSSVVTTNLRNYFTQLLIGELDIAIATSIENYHAKWVGASCADIARLTPDPGEIENEGWQERALERKAQKLATKLAEQMFQERAEQLAQQAKDIVSSGPPPCKCKPQSAVYSCFVKPAAIVGDNSKAAGPSTTASAYWRKTSQDVTQLRMQIEDLKKETIKKADLKLMENNIAKIVQRASVLETSTVATKIIRPTNADSISKYDINYSTPTAIKKNQLHFNGFPKKRNKIYKKHEQAYAVNMCFCDTQKETSKLNKQRKQHSFIEDEFRLSSKDKPRKDIASQILGVKQTKPINDIESAIMNLNNIKQPTRPSCRSNCVCFHKAPSNTSIDNLLETLANLNYTLTATSDQNKTPDRDEYNEINKTFITKVATQLSSVIGKSTKGDINSDISYLKNTVLSKFSISKCNIEDLSKGKEIEQNLPPMTDSEYIGTINLDKSNDILCNCAKENVCNNKSNLETESENKFNFPLKHLNVKTSNYKKHLKESKLDHGTLSQNKEKIQSNLKSEKLSIVDAQKFETNLVTNAENEINYIVNQKDCNCKYNIKFLGVTLSGANSQNVLSNGHCLNNSCNDNYLKEEKFFCEKLEQSLKDKHMDINIDQMNEYLLPCNVKFDEIKHFTGDTFNKQRGDFYKNVDKGIDSQSFKGTIVDKHEMCVCCNKNNFDESRDLELNTFHLLKEHLKDRLEEFRQSACKSSCISSDEQEKIFSTIFQRVKQVISDSTNNIICKCAEDEHSSSSSQGSWNRAYILLQEYLKTKIKRVQCFCVPLQANEKSVLPNVLDRICNLIENDFDRVKKLCKCRNIVNKNEENRFEIQNDLPERDINNDLDTPIGIGINQSSNTKITSPAITTQNISAQVPNNLGMETKSCDIMERGLKNIQTTESCVLLANNYCNSSDLCISCNLNKNKTKLYSELRTTNEMLVNNCVESMKTNKTFNIPTYLLDSKHLSNQVLNKKDKNKEISPSDLITTIPYIGYTIDCSCNKTLGSCICAKCMYAENNVQITNLFKTGRPDPLLSLNSSYIMDSVMNKNTNYILYDRVNDSLHNITDPEPLINAKTREIEVSAYDDNEIRLKYSLNKNLNLSHRMVNTSSDLITKNNLNTQGRLFEFGHHKQNSELQYDTTNENNIKSEINNSAKMLNTHYTSCDCDMIPICHVKMLVENIENKLINSNCTCDSLSSKVCPIHS